MNVLNANMIMLASKNMVTHEVYDRVLIGPLAYRTRDVEVNVRWDVTPGCESESDLKLSAKHHADLTNDSCFDPDPRYGSAVARLVAFVAGSVACALCRIMYANRVTDEGPEPWNEPGTCVWWCSREISIV
jgi:hypothetical protein